MTLIYHTFFAEYEGADAAGVIDALYADAARGTGIARDNWWRYQQELWAARANLHVPDMAAPDAAEQLLDILVQVGALVKGSDPARTKPVSRFGHA